MVAMNKAVLKIICVITIFSMSVACVVGYIAMIRSTEYLTTEIKGKLVNTAENYSHNFSAKFNHMEGLADSLAAHVATTFDVASYESNPKAYLNQYKNELGEMIKKSLGTTEIDHSLYLTFNPDLTPQSDEVWYAWKNDKIIKVTADFKDNKRDFSLPYDDDMAYFFKPQNKKTGVWIEPYYDKDIKQKVFSYSKAIYVNDLFVGVAGADISAEDTISIVKKMKLYPSGYSALLDEKYNFLIYPEEKAKGSKAEISQALKKKLKGKEQADSGIIEYTGQGGESILGYSHLDSGWILINTQPKSEAFGTIKSLENTLAILAVILGIVLVAFLLVFSKPFIKKQNYLEAENRQKDIMIIYQSRQAKIGEMMGNITHQWKQPLNTINLILANLLDSYRYGDLDEERLEKSVSKVENIVNKMSETVSDFSDFLKPSKEKVNFDIKDCINCALMLMEESINQYQIEVEILYEGDTLAKGYPNEISHVVFNILNNARDAIVTSSPIKRKIKIFVEGNQESLKLEIFNNGKAISKEAGENLFKPYFTTKSDIGGTGLGLYISKQIIEERMDGRLTLENVEDGVCCKIVIPKNFK